MKTTNVTCPGWCTPRRCTARTGVGEHRSEPVVLARAGERAAVVVSLVRRIDRRYTTAEIRLSIRLTTSDDAGHARELWALLRRLGRLTREESPR